MENAKKELVEALDDITKQYSVSVKCTWITYKDYSETAKVHAYLPVGFNASELSDFLKEIDFDYDDGWGTQEVFGLVWFDDGSWMERGEYDGAEWWEYRQTPDIPAYLTVEQDWISNT